MRTDALRRAAQTTDINTPQGEPAYRAGLRDKSLSSVVLLKSDPATPCGVGDFTRGLATAIDRHATKAVTQLQLDREGPRFLSLWRSISGARSVICNLPLVAWKRLPLKPLVALGLARISGARAVVMLHEWKSLHPLRRLVYWPALMMSTRIVMFSPFIRDEFESDRWVKSLAQKVQLAPLPPNLSRPKTTTPTETSRALEHAQAQGRVIVGVFGSIYPGKVPLAALDIAAALKACGKTPLLVYIGDFIRATDRIQDLFWARVNEVGLVGDVLVSGYIETPEQLFRIFSRVDAFIYPLPEGVTARRSSILACLQSGRPVIVSAPVNLDEFDHHPRFARLINDGSLTLVGHGAAPEDYAEKILQLSRSISTTATLDVELWWDDLVAAIEQHI